MKQPIMPIRHPQLYLRMTREKGKGVFCAVDVKAGEVLEITPALVLNEADSAAISGTLLENYSVSAAGLPKSAQSWAGVKNAAACRCIPMGMLSFCNHMVAPNAACDELEEGGIVYSRLQALKDIPKDSEITINYGALWFASRKKK